jgi:acetyl-CoA carboxylase biotin carboxylase subunit
VSRILVPNRGEIALRVIRACRELGHESVIAHSEADADTLPVRVADRSVCIGPADPSASYLDQDLVLSAAEMHDVDAIHPGYGMLSENASFAKNVADSGYTFIGPSSETIQLMGQKSEARRRLKEAGMPVLPGSDGDLETLEEAREVAERVEYPLMLKASEGGGGRGIAKVHDEEELDEQFERVQSEAEAAFGSGRIYIEKLVEDPRHIEFQVMGDGNGEVVQFFERECSIQRRHQKLLEEAPSPALSEERRQELADTIVEALETIEYGNAGTLEMVMDEDENAYVIEVNTRIQVEHPVTEMICDRDLIKIQIETALSGELPLSQEDVDYEGHAMEVRVCAEDPASQFAPEQGTIESLQLPGGPGIRNDTYVENGTWVSPYYDSMIGKIIAHDADRTQCIDRIDRALHETVIDGINTTIPLFRWMLRDDSFREGTFNTSFLDDRAEEWQSALDGTA